MGTEIVTQEPRPHIPMVNGIAAPKDVDGVFRLAQLFAQAGMLPHGVSTPQQVCIMLMAGLEVGLSPTQSIQNVMVVNNRPTIWGDAAIGLVWASGKMKAHDEGIKGEGEARYAYCTVQRDGDAQPYTVTFSVADAKNAGLWGKAGPWKSYPDRMLKLRARAFALRDKFADVLKGLSITEEVQDYDAPKSVPSVTVELGETRPARKSITERLVEQPSIAPGAAVDSTTAVAPSPSRKGEKPKFDVQGNIVEDIDAAMNAAKDTNS